MLSRFLFIGSEFNKLVMSYTANIYNIMIASPSDLKDEAKVAIDVINEWNQYHAFKEKIVLIPKEWSTLAPVVNNQPVQLQIDKKLLHNADILVTIFWHKYGTATSAFPSATVHELETHLKSSKPALLYFSEKPVKPSDINSSQLEEVKSLKQEYYSKGKVDTFVSTEDFKYKFRNHLIALINDDEYNISGYQVKNTSQTSQIHYSDSLNAVVLSEEAKQILYNAVRDKNVQILYSSYVEDIVTNNVNLMHNMDERKKAKFKAGLQTLLTHNFIQPVGTKGEMFKVINAGFDFADTMRVDTDVAEFLTELSKKLLVAIRDDNVIQLNAEHWSGDRIRYSATYHSFITGPDLTPAPAEYVSAIEQLCSLKLLFPKQNESWQLTHLGLQVGDDILGQEVKK